MKYVIFTRYEFWGPNGKGWCNWFKNGGYLFDTENDAKAQVKRFKETSKTIDKYSKCKHEYEIRLIDEHMIAQPILKRSSGRPKKIDTTILDKIAKDLNKKGEAKIPETVKRYVYNDTVLKEYISRQIKDDSKQVRYWYDNNKNLYAFLKDKNLEIIY